MSNILLVEYEAIILIQIGDTYMKLANLCRKSCKFNEAYKLYLDASDTYIKSHDVYLKLANLYRKSCKLNNANKSYISGIYAFNKSIDAYKKYLKLKINIINIRIEILNQKIHHYNIRTIHNVK